MIVDSLRFMYEFVRHPMAVGAVVPSAPTLADRITSTVPGAGHPVVVELGPGTGAFTAAIQRRLAGRGHHVAIEVNSRFAAHLTARYRRVDVLAADAARLPDVLRRRGHTHADVIVSGLPWAAFTAHRQAAILDAVTAGLAPGGAFTTFAYLHALWTPPARRLRHALRQRFEEVVASRTVWPNIPPALVYYARRPTGRPVTSPVEPASPVPSRAVPRGEP